MARVSTTPTTTTTTAPARKPAPANGTPAAARVKPVSAKVLKALAALGEPDRLAVLGFLARQTGPVKLEEIVVAHLGANPEKVTLVVDHLKRRGWLDAERAPKGNGGGWRYRLSDAGRERLMALGG